ncbi:MAG TPA: ATP-binding cassette domain-containing protein [Candidatus Scybalomonas excrementigallinarum]|nr:ATP-binding cassette domain-containing protein [Candidatus Scybalomonas excrementigallinarum]
MTFRSWVVDNIDLYRNNDFSEIRNCMEQLKIDYLSLEKTVNNMNGISGGEKSRVCLARAILSLPKFLIVDEPTAALDDKTSLEVMKFLCQLPVTVIIIGHHMKKEQLKLFDEVIDLNHLS